MHAAEKVNAVRSPPMGVTDSGGASEVVRYEKRGRVAHVTLDRPRVLNALDHATHRRLGEIWDDVENDERIWLAVLGGAGERAFSVGQDLKELSKDLASAEAIPSSFGSRGRPGWPRLTERFDMAKPVVARVHGYVLGGGFELALACDLIIASADAVFALPEARRGLVPGAGGVFRLMRQIPSKAAMGYLLTGREMSADRAFELGLVNEVVPRAELDDAVESWVRDILASAPLSVRAIKEAAAKSSTLTLEGAFRERYFWEEKRRSSEDAREGPRAFAEKRLPRWSGR